MSLPPWLPISQAPFVPDQIFHGACFPPIIQLRFRTIRSFNLVDSFLEKKNISCFPMSIQDIGTTAWRRCGPPWPRPLAPAPSWTPGPSVASGASAAPPVARRRWFSWRIPWAWPSCAGRTPRWMATWLDWWVLESCWPRGKWTHAKLQMQQEGGYCIQSTRGWNVDRFSAMNPYFAFQDIASISILLGYPKRLWFFPLLFFEISASLLVQPPILVGDDHCLSYFNCHHQHTRVRQHTWRLYHEVPLWTAFYLVNVQT